MTHTPGPWIYDTRNNRIVVEDENNRFTIADAGFGTSQVAEANARLIAAAPELLDILTSTVTGEVYADAASVSPWLRARRKEALALIARVHGEEQDDEAVGERERGDDDGVEYADPRDARDDRD